jgi:SAM-dependent methyltransferase
MSATDDNYDRIARFYDVDMARNMAFDDVAFYRDLCVQARGPVLELGCGNGRILLDLLAHGIDVVGVDASAGMLAELRRKAGAQGLPARIARMDIRRLGLRPGFAVILCPYSLITYVTDDDEVAALLRALLSLLRPGGLCVVDAFIPRPRAAVTTFALDYRRPYGAGTLARWKRISAVSATVNRIERRYVVEDASGHALDVIEVAEDIRPRSAAELSGHLVAAGFAMPAPAWDYGMTTTAATAQFATLMARRPGA